MSNLSEVDIKMNEYYKLKNNYENTLNDLKKKIINNNQLSKKEKRQEFLTLKPKCINCKRHRGTIIKN
jgi:poly(3-hydroxyalkanoate) synthetase